MRSPWAHAAPLATSVTLLALLVLLALSCASDPLRARASMDLRCDEDRLQMKKLREDAQDVSGCGQRAVYVKKCPSCDWTMGPPDSAP